MLVYRTNKRMDHTHRVLSSHREREEGERERDRALDTDKWIDASTERQKHRQANS